MISFIVPAHNEEAYLPGTLDAIHESAQATGAPYEVIVVNDASTDATAEVARQHGARVVDVNHRQIAATRNSGARAASGERFFFIDADTKANPRAVMAAMRAMDKGAVGGGAPTWVGFQEKVPLWFWLLSVPALLMPKLAGFSGGAFMFCTLEAFLATGGFNERVYCSEELGFALALRREGRFAGLLQPVLTSGRRLRKVSGLQLIAGFSRIFIFPVKTFTQRSMVEKIWYDSNRKDDHIMPDSLMARACNALVFALLFLILTQPVWARLPWSWTPYETLLGKIRYFAALGVCHLGVLIFWPTAAILLVNLLRQKRFTGIFQSLAVISFLVWNVWDITPKLALMWWHFFQQLI